MGCQMCTDENGRPLYVGCGPGDPCGSMITFKSTRSGQTKEHLFTVYVEKDKTRPDVLLVPKGCDPPDDDEYEALGEFTMITLAGKQKKGDDEVPVVKVQFPTASAVDQEGAASAY